MKLDHYAIRCHNKLAAMKFYQDALGYKVQEHFELDMDDGSKAMCVAMVPSELGQPDIFISEGTPNSVVDTWIKKYGNGIGGIHHVAYAVDNVADAMNQWKKNNWAEFTTDLPIESPDIIQCFTKPHLYTGVVYELVKRLSNKGFNKNNVKKLMQSTK